MGDHTRNSGAAIFFFTVASQSSRRTEPPAARNFLGPRAWRAQSTPKVRGQLRIFGHQLRVFGHQLRPLSRATPHAVAHTHRRAVACTAVLRKALRQPLLLFFWPPPPTANRHCARPCPPFAP